MSRALYIPVTAALIFHICILVASGQQNVLTQLTFSDSAQYGFPHWSPDGHYIIYSSVTSSGCQTMKIPSLGGIAKPITENFARHARWSPSGDYIAFDGDSGKMMQIIPASGGTPVRIDPLSVPISGGGMPVWSPDGRKIAFRSISTIYMIDLETGSLTELFSSAGGNAFPYDWSPDGSKLLVDVWNEADSSQSDIWEVPLHGLPRQITFLPGRQTNPAISSDGSLMVFTSDHGGKEDLWIMPASEGGPLQLTGINGEDENPGSNTEGSWSPDGSSIAFSSTRNDMSAIWRMDLNLEAIKNKFFETVSYSVLLPTIDTATIPVFPFVMSENPMLPSPAVSWDGREFVLTKTDSGNYAWFDATVENGDTLNYKKRMRGKGNQLIADRADFPVLAATGIHSLEEISNTRTITGRSVSRITVDGRPGASSGTGFMAADETILSVITGDNRMVVKLGLKHPDLARPLLHLWNISNSAEKHNEHVSDEERIQLSGLVYGGREIGINISGGRGWQESLFSDEILGSYILEAWRDLDPDELEFLERHYGHLSEDEFDELKRMISTLQTGEMVPYYINRYGFYEGHADFRAEPLSIAFIFGIRSLEEIHLAAGGNLYGYLTKHFTENP